MAGLRRGCCYWAPSYLQRPSRSGRQRERARDDGAESELLAALDASVQPVRRQPCAVAVSIHQIHLLVQTASALVRLATGMYNVAYAKDPLPETWALPVYAMPGVTVLH